MKQSSSFIFLSFLLAGLFFCVYAFAKEKSYSGTEMSQGDEMEQLATRFEFLSGRLGKIPEPPQVSRLNEIALPPDIRGGTIVFGEQEKKEP